MIFSSPRATMPEFASEYDKIRSRGASLTNIFLNASELESRFNKKQCLLDSALESLFLRIPRHDSFYDLLFLSLDKGSLADDLRSMLQRNSSELPLRVSLINKEEALKDLVPVFEEAGFRTVKKLFRTRLAQAPESVRAAMRIFAEDYEPYLGFAVPGDENEILEILKESFDTVGDNIPELDEIAERIKKREIAVLRKDNRILSLNYFEIRSGIMHSYYDINRPEFRGGHGLYMALMTYVGDRMKESDIHIKRVLGWRESAKKKLIKHAEKSNELADGIIIYNMLLEPSSH